MTTVEVLCPVRLETRFVAPADRDDGGQGWLLRLRVYPDEVSIHRTVPPPSPAELDRLDDAVAAMTTPAEGQLPSGRTALAEPEAFAAFAAAVGAARALYLWRTRLVADAEGTPRVDRTGQGEPQPSVAHGPAGLPERLDVWLVHTDGSSTLAATLRPDPNAISADLDLPDLGDQIRLADGTIPPRWWLSYRRAVDVGLGKDIDLGAVPPDLDALVVVGAGQTDAGDLIGDHTRTGRIAVLGQGTPTNTVAGQPAADLGTHAATFAPLLHVDPATQQSTRNVLTALTGRIPDGALPLPDGDLDHYGPQSLAVQGFWPVLWGRHLRDVVGASDIEPALARWAIRHLAVEGPRPAIRVGEQPYGLLPTSAFADWVDDGQPDPGQLDPTGIRSGDVEARILAWALPWRSRAAAATRTANRWVHGADTAALLDVLGLHAPNRRHRMRPIADLAVLQAIRAFTGLPAMPATSWDRDTSAALRGVPHPLRAIGPASRGGPIPGPEADAVDTADALRDLCHLDPEPLYFQGIPPLGLVGHLFRESLIAARALVGRAADQLAARGTVDPDTVLPTDDEGGFVGAVQQGTDEAAERLATSGDDDARTVAHRFREVQEALEVFADLWDPLRNQMFRATLAALDAATFRVDPWLTGIADRRLTRLASAGAPFRLGCYGWVDAPAPYKHAAAPPETAVLPPGPTAAGLLHAPSHTQALTAALLRDAAVRYPGDDRWRLTLDSAGVRAADALAERVRLGVHPYEALGLEVEKVAGDWDAVRVLRQNYPLVPDQDLQLRRVCDGAAVLRAAREGALVAGLPAGLAAALAPLDRVLDTYADLLVADGAHALATGRGDLAAEAMEAAAGLGPPSTLRSIRTPRAAATVRTSVWALLPAPPVGGPPPAGPDGPPIRIADPAFVGLLAAEDGAQADPDGHAATALAELLGGGEPDAPAPSLTGGDHEGLGPDGDAALRAAAASDLRDRLDRLRAAAMRVRDDLVSRDGNDPDLAAAVQAAAIDWAVDLAETGAAERRDAVATELGDRLADTGPGPAPGPSPEATPELISQLRERIRRLAGRAWLAVIPVVESALVPVLREAPDLDRTWLGIVAAVRPRLAALEARRLDPVRPPWPAAVAAPDGSVDPWHREGPVVVAVGTGVPAALARSAGSRVGLAVLDAWSESVPSRRHATSASFGFNAPKSRAPQAILLAVPPEVTTRLDSEGLLRTVLETRELVHARGARPGDRTGLPFATPTPLVHASGPASFLKGWPV